MYTSVSIANSRRLLTKIEKSGDIAKVRILVEIDTGKRLKTLRIISSEMLISRLIQC